MPRSQLPGLRAAAVALAFAAAAASPASALVDPEVAGYIAVPGGRIWYRMNGVRHFPRGATPILAVHGGPGGNHRSGLPLVALAAERPVILYDQLDSGHSDRPGDEANWKLERFVAEIDAIRAHLGLSRVIVLGHSWGGTVAAAYAAGRPAGLEALILSSPLISTPRWISDNAAWVAALPESVREVIARHEAAGTIDSAEYAAAVEVFNRRHLCRDPCPVGDMGNDAPPFNATLYRAMWGPSEFTATGTLRALDLTPELDGIEAPTLYLCGSWDEATPDACQDFSERTPGARFEEVPEAGHATRYENPGFYLDAVRRFLAQVEAP
jgi:proline iminopeptidase